MRAVRGGHVNPLYLEESGDLDFYTPADPGCKGGSLQRRRRSWGNRPRGSSRARSDDGTTVESINADGDCARHEWTAKRERNGEVAWTSPIWLEKAAKN
ncbi:MAG: hypothetical protein CMN78_02325 [Spirochaetales bacterium]|nr:hypothetical protein [Spirochaetales bacterium]